MKRTFAVLGASIVALTVVGTGGTAHASSTVHTGGHVSCQQLNNKYAGAKSITIRLDTGESHTVSTGVFNDVYRIDFSRMPSGGTGANVTVNCSNLAGSPGAHSIRAFFKPDWRNTTGDHNFSVSNDGTLNSWQ